MREQSPSLTAQRVAAYRLGLARLQTPFGDPSADERLARDVAGPMRFTHSEAMAGYLQARTSFFDRVVVNGLERGVSQVACVGAGYDGRALRYAEPGVRWFEIDHPATQADKRARLEQLKLDVSHITFVPLDLDLGGVDAALAQGGFDPEAPSLMLCEGLAVYLDPPILETLLLDLRSLATAGTRLAISLPFSATAPDQLARRERLRAALAALGEPARNELTSDDAAEMLQAARWRTVAVSERSRGAGFTVAAPLWAPAAPEAPPTQSRVGGYLEQLYHRRGTDGLSRHLCDAYDIEVRRIRELDIGVFRVDRRDGPAWVARIFPQARAIQATQRDAAILKFLERSGFPAERCARPEPVTSYQGQAALVTEHLPGRQAKPTETACHRLGDLLGRLHTLTDLPAAATRPGGAWHHLALEGNPAGEVAAILSLLDNAAGRVPASQRDLYQTLLTAASKVDDCQGLPQALIHPDFAPANAVVSAPANPTIIDWTGAGQGPRLWSLAFLLWAAGLTSLKPIDSVISAYRQHVQLEAAELARLTNAIATRPVIFSSWAFATGRERLPSVVERLPKIRARAEKIAARVLKASPAV
jgi:methyltransferase (TIGR00027 family)